MQSLAKYHGRSPRYVLNTDDDNLVRFSGSERLPWEEKTELRNISLTGLSFTAPADLSPVLSEIIKIQFTVPGGKQMACYAIVIRIEEENEFENLVGIHFYKLDRLQRINLLQGLSEKATTSKKQTEVLETPFFTKFIAITGLIMTIVCWYTLMKLYFL